MMDSSEPDFRPAPASPSTEFVRGRRIEIVGGFQPDAVPEHVLFDFDGTLSLIREGWSNIMVPMMVEFLQAESPDEPTSDLERLCSEFVMELTGKQTIYQMIRLAEEIAGRGGTPRDPLEYKAEYHRRLMMRIDQRRESLRRGETSPRDLLVPGSIELLDALVRRGVKLYLASGTDEHYVCEEVELLGLDQYFQGRVYGAVDDYRSFSKELVIRRILSEHQPDPRTLLGFGDGYVEVQNVRDAGGVAVGVATDETNRSGRPDAWKRQRLLGAGAHVIVPDFAEAEFLVDWLFSSM